MSALAYLRSQAAEARASGEKPYSLFMVSPERVLGMKRAAEPFRSVEDGGDAETYRYAKTPRTAVKTRPVTDDNEDEESRYNLRSKTPTTMMKSMNKLGLYVPPAMRNPKDPETDGTVQKTEGRKVGFAIPAPRVEVYKSSNRENHPPGFGPSSNNVEGAPSAKELPTPKPAPLAAICRNAAVASRKRSSTADVGGKPGVNSSEAGGGARRGSRSRGGRGRSGSSTRTVTVVIPKASAGPR